MDDVVLSKPYQEDRPWGSFAMFDHNDLFTVKIITVNPGESTSLQYHHHRQESWIVVAGSGFVDIGTTRYTARKNDWYTVRQDTVHRLTAADEPFVIVEISTGKFDEKDIVRIADKYGRADQQE